jgi:hypothetical protein
MSSIRSLEIIMRFASLWRGQRHLPGTGSAPQASHETLPPAFYRAPLLYQSVDALKYLILDAG